MPFHYCTSLLIGTGTEVDPFRPAIADVVDGWRAVVADDATAGAQALCLIDVADPAVIGATGTLLDNLSETEITAIGQSIQPEFSLEHFG